MPAHFNNIVDWSDINLMNINFNKTKEMLLGSINKNSTPNISINSTVVERISMFKLVGVHVESNLKWSSHIHLFILTYGNAFAY